MEKRYESYVFDLYGTLADIRTDEEDSRVWDAFCWELRLRGAAWESPAALRETYLRLCAENLQEKEALLRERGLPGPAEADILAVFRGLPSLRGAEASDPEVLDIARTFRALTLRRLLLFPGAAEVLAALRKAGKRVILLTNAQAAFTMPELTYLGIRDAFHKIIISGDAGVRKPSTAFFTLLREAGADPGRSVMVGNDDVCDCGGAAAFGMDSLYIRSPQSPPRSGPLPDGCREIFSLPEIFSE